MSAHNGRGDVIPFPDRQKLEVRRQGGGGASKPDNRIVIREYDHIIFICTVLLVGIGLVMVLSASYYSALHSGNVYEYFTMQAIGAGLGLVGMFFAATINYKLVSKFSTIFYWASNVLLVYTALFGIEFQGARRWVSFGGVNFQPSELTKVAVILMLAVYLNRDRNRVNTVKGVLGYIALTLIPVALVMWGRNLSTAIILLAIGFVILFLASPYFWRFIAVAAAAISAAIGFFIIDYQFLGGFRGSRFMVWQDPFSDPSGFGFQTIQSLFAIASGGLFGRGLGNSMQKRYYLPEAQNDFIFAIIIEELGLFGGGIVLLLFAIIVWRGTKAAMASRDTMGLLIAAGITTMIAVQVIINVGVVTNFIPNTGIPLPFISYGGTSIAVMMTAVGLLLNVSRYQRTN
ncbi:MAG: FtsW/RodA/SpoVE family cell cycle protein [Defluviitaleaceae bacterium]|nr:FtsW/RodA/SpoVE family cell cycle protein [Defluviitaleaceae bacterium]